MVVVGAFPSTLIARIECPGGNDLGTNRVRSAVAGNSVYRDDNRRHALGFSDAENIRGARGTSFTAIGNQRHRRFDLIVIVLRPNVLKLLIHT